MNDFAKEVINKLLDKYEKSVISKEGSRRNLEVKIKNTTTEPLFREYNYNAHRFADQERIEETLRTLEKKNLIRINWHNQFVKDIILNLYTLNEAYDYVGRKSKTELDKEIVTFLSGEALLNTNETIVNFAQALIRKITSYESTLSYYKNIDELVLTFKGLEALIYNDAPILLRNFSEKAFGDSKYFEKHQSLFLRIFQEFTEDEQYDSFDELCKRYNIFKNPIYLYVKNGLIYKVNEQVINLNDYKLEMAISLSAVEIMEIKALNVKKVITIENLTTFNYYQDSEAMLIYTAGFAGSEVISFIKKLALFDSTLSWQHFGDIDVNGLRILQVLREATKQDFKPLYMDLETIKKHRKYCKKLTDNDQNALELLLTDNRYREFQDLVSYMLEHNIKLEQEAVV